MDESSAIAHDFFAGYAAALLSRDVDRIAGHYGCPALIAFPGNTIAVTDPEQTRTFFASAVDQYDGVTHAAPTIEVMGSTVGSLWADVRWDYGDEHPGERMCYQLLEQDGQWRIGVLTPMGT